MAWWASSTTTVWNWRGSRASRDSRARVCIDATTTGASTSFASAFTSPSRAAGSTCLIYVIMMGTLWSVSRTFKMQARILLAIGFSIYRSSTQQAVSPLQERSRFKVLRKLRCSHRISSSPVA